MNTIAFKLETIDANIKARHEEIAGYEINIYNYEFMANSGQIPESEYLNQLRAGIESNMAELQKVKLILAALEEQKIHIEAIQAA
jgi:hypothetical protein